MFDIVIENGLIVDGSGNKPFKADIGIQNDRIKEIGDLHHTQADKRINAEGLIVTPGFIDSHSHSDFTLLICPKAESYITQGVTTQVIGMCGYSCAPLPKDKKDEIISLIPGYMEDSGINISWETFNEFLNFMESKRIAINVIPFVGHNTIRVASIGYQSRKANDSEILIMKDYVEEAMKAGAFGLSTGLAYAQSRYSDTKEVIELAKIASKYNGIYDTHIRSYATQIKHSIEETIRVCKEANIPTEIAHFRSTYGGGISTKDALKMVENAISSGLDIMFDMYPYTWAASVLTAFLPPWVFEGGIKELLRRLESKEQRKKIAECMKQPLTGREYYIQKGAWNEIMIVFMHKKKEYEGKTLLEISKEENKDPLETYFDLILEEGEKATSALISDKSTLEEDLDLVITNKYCMIGSDGSATCTFGKLKSFKWHPRLYGTFPRVLRLYVKEKNLLSLEQTVMKMTYMPAKRFMIKDRGLIKTGYKADITIMNFDKIKDNATLKEPNLLCEGIEYVIVNGKFALYEGKQTEELAGKVLRHG